MTQATYGIGGMTCGGCVNSVTKALQQALPGATILVELEGALVRVEGEHDAEKVKQTIEAAGFDFGGAREG